MAESHTLTERQDAQVGTGASTGVALGVAGLDILSGLFGFMAGQEIAGITASRARMLRDESEADIQRFTEQADRFKAGQKLRFLKAGVALTGSPLDILDETSRIAAENISAIRARGRGLAEERRIRGAEAVSRGRAALLGGFTRAAAIGVEAFRQRERVERTQVPRNR